MKKKMTFAEMNEMFTKHNQEIGVTHQFKDENRLIGYIVYDQSSFSRPYTEFERTYKVQSDNKCFIQGMGGNSMYGDCLDGLDQCLRLDHIGWKIECCYVEVEETEA